MQKITIGVEAKVDTKRPPFVAEVGEDVRGDASRAGWRQYLGTLLKFQHSLI